MFITARFRSGSTLLWNLFRRSPQCTAYYEPFNERRWFDPISRGGRVDATHRGVADYWAEYEGLSSLNDYYDEGWIRRRLVMDEKSWLPDMKRFIKIIIEKAPALPVLQFNRIDFRLPWIRHHFPTAKLVHLYRHPRDQWVSTLLDDARRCPQAGTMAEFANCDHFYLRCWARDLKHHFEFLDESQVEHPYELFYYVWKLSYLYGRQYADYSLAFEDLVSNTEAQVKELGRVVEVDLSDCVESAKITPPLLGKWRQYAEDAWFAALEARCETLLSSYFSTTG